MAKRKLYQKVQVSSEGVGGKTNFDLEYYVLEKEVTIDGMCINTYGVEISKLFKGDDGVVYKEYRKVFDIFCTEREAEAVLKKLARNTVTPISLLDVLENLIGTGDLINEETSFVAV